MFCAQLKRLQTLNVRCLSTNLKSNLNRSSIHPNDIEQFDGLQAKILPKIRKFIEKNSDENVAICNHKSFDELQSILSSKNGELLDDDKMISDDNIMDIIDLIFDYSPRTQKSRYVDKLYCGSDAISQYATYILSIINNNCHTYHSSQILTLIEDITIRNLCKIFYKQNDKPYGGVFFPGGAYSNMMAFRLARDKYFPSISSDGPYCNFNGIVLTSDQSHYSVMTSISQIGIGSNNVLKLETNNDGTINIEKCKLMIQHLINNENKKPFILSCNAGTTVFGAFDDFIAISNICKEYDIWMHVDGCWGGAVVFGRDNNKICNKLVNGIEFADSISFDAHKLLSTGLLCGCLLVKDEKYLYESCAPPNAKYLFHSNNNIDIGLKTIQCGRQCDALKLYLSWLYYGNNGLYKRVENALNNANYLCQLIKKSNDFMLVQELEFCNVCFWYIGEYNVDDIDLNDSNIVNMLETNTKNIYSKLQQDANSMIDYSPCKGLPSFFRMITSNYRLTYHDIDIILNDIRNAAELCVYK